MDTDEIREELESSPISSGVERWYRRYLLRALDEIDRLETELHEIDENTSILTDVENKVEQRTKEACFKAGWEWMIHRWHGQYGKEPDKESFKRAFI